MIQQSYYWKEREREREISKITEIRILTRSEFSMFSAALFTIDKMWKQPKRPLTDEWIEKMWSIHTTEYYSALKKKEILQHAPARMDLEDIMLSETSYLQKDKYFMTDYTRMRYLK